LGSRINMIMQAAFFKLGQMLFLLDDAGKYLKEEIVSHTAERARLVVDMNFAAVDRGIESLVKINSRELENSKG
jgi:pyruvate-ferredoxin/flavodoxin oxidoreductase